MAFVIHTIDVWGDFACFSCLKVERWSYPLPTPSAARGVFDSIFCHPPEFRWEITRVEVHSPPRYIALRRNEVKEVVNTQSVQRWMRGVEEPAPIWADADKSFTGSDARGRTQRQTMALLDVRFRLSARIRPWPGQEGRAIAFDEQFRRRVEAGKCFSQPYLGCREFVAFFGPPNPNRTPFDLTADLGLMPLDIFDLSRPGFPDSPPRISLFPAIVRSGVMDVPPYDAPEVIKPPASGDRRS